MGILDSISKNPSFLALAALGIGLFIFRDKISGFFSDITGGAQGTAQIAETGGILARNLQSNLTATPLAGDPLFGESGFFTNIAESISNFKLPTFEFPSFPSFPTTTTEPSDFTDVGMAGARGERGGELARTPPLPPEFRDLEGLPTRAEASDFGVTAAPSIAETIIAPFMGGGVSFEGGTIFATDPTVQGFEDPLSFITEQQGITASQAANQLAIAQGFTSEEQAFLSQGQEISPLGDLASQSQVSDPQFQGLTPEQIFLQLVGGNISNF